MINSEAITTAIRIVSTLAHKIPHEKTRAITLATAEATVLGMESYQLIQSVRGTKTEMQYFLHVDSFSEGLNILMERIGLGRNTKENPKILKADSDEYYDDELDRYITSMYYSFDLAQPERIVWDGVEMTVEKQTDEKTKRSYTVFGFKNVSDRDKFTQYMDDLVRKECNSVPTDVLGNKTSPVFRFNGDGEEFNQDYLTNCARPLDTVIVNGEVKNKITQHIETFLAHEESYKEISMPYHTGILLYGPPGTGKTSLVSALAREYDMPLYILNLRHFHSDAEFVRAVRSIRTRAMVVLEDIDTITPSRSETVAKTKDGLSLDSVLNFLDGMSTPHGTIMVMTTNNKNHLDPAMTRPGRMDVSAPIEYFTPEMVVEFCQRFISTDEDFSGKLIELAKDVNDESKLTGAELASVLKETMFLDTEGKKEFMLDFIDERV